MAIWIRTENKSDYAQVHQIHFTAFGNREDEAELVERIREIPYFVPELSIVAEKDGLIIGHILLSKADVVDGEQRHEVLALAPIAVAPDYQKKGVGKQLIHAALQRGKELGFSLVLLIGHPSYYPKFGFIPARSYGLELKQFDVPDDVFMICELQAGAIKSIKGELIYPGAFFG